MGRNRGQQSPACPRQTNTDLDHDVDRRYHVCHIEWTDVNLYLYPYMRYNALIVEQQNEGYTTVVVPRSLITLFTVKLKEMLYAY